MYVNWRTSITYGMIWTHEKYDRNLKLPSIIHSTIYDMCSYFTLFPDAIQYHTIPHHIVPCPCRDAKRMALHITIFCRCELFLSPTEAALTTTGEGIKGLHTSRKYDTQNLLHRNGFVRVEILTLPSYFV